MKIFTSAPIYNEKAICIADKMNFEFCDDLCFAEDEKIYLLYGENGLELTDGRLSMAGDFEKLLPRLKVNNLNGESVVKSAKIKNRTGVSVIDATAGMGEDSFLLAGAGFNVTLIEYNPVIAALLFDTVERAKINEKLKDICKNMTFIYGNSIDLMKNGKLKADVVLLDPMFPERKKSGLIKKKFQLLQQLECPCDDEISLFESAFIGAENKIIVKRPAKGEFLAKRKPSYSYNGNSIRYDIYVK